MKLISYNKILLKTLFMIASVMFLWFSAFGLMYHMNLMKSESNSVNGCLFNGEVDVCVMNFSEHIALWQSMITSLPQQVGGILSLLLLIVLSIIVTNFRYSHPHELLIKNISSRWRLYIKQHPHIHLFNFLREAFSRGILNTKIYSLASI